MDSWKKAFLYFVWSGFLISIMGSGFPMAAQDAAGTKAAPSPAPPMLTANADAATTIPELPDSPGATAARPAEAKPQSASETTTASASASSSQTQQSPSGRTQTNSQTPVGTAVAESPNASGVAASQPAGVAIAPAKQRRVRTIVLRMGAIVGAGVAVGSVVALTAGTSSKPPGAH